jgi:hypothetical protein
MNEPEQIQRIKKPVSIKVFGVLSCVFGGLGILFGLAVFAGMAINEFVEKIADENKMQTVLEAALWLFMSAWQLTTGIGLLVFLKWARKWSIIYSCVDIGWTLSGLVFDIIKESPNWAGPLDAAKGTYLNIMGFTYPVLLLIFMKTAKVKQAFEK